MLVLSRKVGERILIGDKISVTVVRISGGGVRIGIEAPAEMAVVREELQQEMLDAKASGKGDHSDKSTDAAVPSQQDASVHQKLDPSNALTFNGDRLSADESSPAKSSSSHDQENRGIPRSTRRKPR